MQTQVNVLYCNLQFVETNSWFMVEIYRLNTCLLLSIIQAPYFYLAPKISIITNVAAWDWQKGPSTRINKSLKEMKSKPSKQYCLSKISKRAFWREKWKRQTQWLTGNQGSQPIRDQLVVTSQVTALFNVWLKKIQGRKTCGKSVT